MKSKLGLYGGSFDPVHLGHLLVAQAAREEMGLEQVIFLPAAQSPFKPNQTLAPAAERTKLLRAALAGLPWARVDTSEVERGGISYTIDTVRRYRELHPEAELNYLIGADHVAQLHKWREAEDLCRLVEFLVIPRPGEVPVHAPQFARTRGIKGFPIAVSSSEIRARVAAGQPIELLTGAVVAELIRNNRLYL